MISSKKIAKRSIAGRRVCALFSDGIYYPGVIRGIKTSATGEAVFEVAGKHGKVREFTSHSLVGHGFQSVSTVHLKFNQPVFTTLNGREVKAVVQKHRKQTNEVLLKTVDSSELNFKQKLENVRLMESRKSGRLFDIETDYFKLADVTEAKKRPVSTSIEVPSAKAQKVDETEPPMDDVMAAMVLTSLSGTGSSLLHRERNPSGDSVISLGPMSPTSSLSSGYGNVSPSPSPSALSHFSWDVSRSTPSPASSSSDMESSPHPHPPFSSAQGPDSSSLLFSSSVDEGIDISSGSVPFTMEDATPHSPTKKPKTSVRTCYKCTWQGCGKTLSTVQGIERHIRTIHLRKRDGDEYSDHEEEFYYTEIDTTVESVSDTLANMFTSSPPPTHFTFDLSRLPHPHGAADHKPTEESSSPTPKDRPRGRNLSGCSNTSTSSGADSPILIGSVPNQASTMMASPVNIPCGSPVSWCSVSTSVTSFSYPTVSVHMSQATGCGVRHKSAALHHKAPSHGSASQPKIRSEGKKCRKVYGMDNRDLWCTQCRWKKACVRFT